MVAALSWAARLKAGLARTREVLNTPVSELFVRRRVDESLFRELEAALLEADCGVAATQWVLDCLRKKKIEESDELKRALKEVLMQLLGPLERTLDVTRAKPFVIMIAGVNGQEPFRITSFIRFSRLTRSRRFRSPFSARLTACLFLSRSYRLATDIRLAMICLGG